MLHVLSKQVLLRYFAVAVSVLRSDSTVTPGLQGRLRRRSRGRRASVHVVAARRTKAAEELALGQEAHITAERPPIQPLTMTTRGDF